MTTKANGKSRVQSGAKHVAGQRGLREESVKGGGSKTATVDTELGFSVQMTEADRLAEKLAAMRDELEVKQTNIKTVLDDLRTAMHQESRTFVKGRAPSGIAYTFELSQPDEKVVIKKAAE